MPRDTPEVGALDGCLARVYSERRQRRWTASKLDVQLLLAVGDKCCAWYADCRDTEGLMDATARPAACPGPKGCLEAVPLGLTDFGGECWGCVAINAGGLQLVGVACKGERCQRAPAANSSQASSVGYLE